LTKNTSAFIKVIKYLCSSSINKLDKLIKFYANFPNINNFYEETFAKVKAILKTELKVLIGGEGGMNVDLIEEEREDEEERLRN
jgi:hypothetical protein